MNKRPIMIGLATLAMVSMAHGDETRKPADQTSSPYVGQEGREIKALSSEEVDDYINGRGMGMAKAAELNRHPGPRHVLELSSDLGLSPKQIDETRRVHDVMHNDAVRLGEIIVEKERELDALFARLATHEAGSHGTHGSESAVGGAHERMLQHMQQTVVDLGRLGGELRAAHLSAHLQMRRILSQDQIDRYVELRGYAGGSGHHQHGHGRHRH